MKRSSIYYGISKTSFLITLVELCSTASNSKCCWCTQTCKSVLPRASWTQSRTLGASGLPAWLTSEAATVWAGTGNQRDEPGRTQRTAAELCSDCRFGSASKSGCLSSAGRRRTPWLSTLPAAQATFCAGLPCGRLSPGFAGGSGKQRLHPPGPGDGGRRPPRA